MSCPTEGAFNILISSSVFPSSASFTNSVSSTCTTASAPGGSGAPVLIRKQNPGITPPCG